MSDMTREQLNRIVDRVRIWLPRVRASEIRVHPEMYVRIVKAAATSAPMLEPTPRGFKLYGLPIAEDATLEEEAITLRHMSDEVQVDTVFKLGLGA